ncbi:MAG: hypothetical protein K2L34_09720 [Muribaculaceae bacterium]|nr:hypothetical protein [Muribaculaceae bacterium]
MSEQELKSYRLVSLSEPSEEMLAIIMDKAVDEVRESNRKSDEIFFANLRNAATSRRAARHK